MYDNKRLNQFLEEGEIIRWSGTPQPYSIFDETHRTSTLTSLCWALVWEIILVGGYYILCASKGIEIKEGIMIFCVVFPLLLAWRPVTRKNNIKKLM